MSSDHLPILIGLQKTATSYPARHRTYININEADWTRYRQEIERKLSARHLPTDCQKDEKLFRATLLKAVSHHISTGRRKLYMQQVPAEILAMMEERDDLRKQDPASPRLSTINDEISKTTLDHKRRKWRDSIESIDHRTDSTKLWWTMKGFDGKSKQTSTHYKTADTDLQHCIQYITNIPHSVLTGDVNAHSTLWHSYTDDHRGQLIADVISNSDHITLNTTQPECQTPHYNKHHHQTSPRCLTHFTTGHRGQLNTHYHQTTYP